ncbi:MAG: hypothetical protein RLZZ187_3219, partial [Pseudomonadota bacterium]
MTRLAALLLLCPALALAQPATPPATPPAPGSARPDAAA